MRTTVIAAVLLLASATLGRHGMRVHTDGHRRPRPTSAPGQPVRGHRRHRQTLPGPPIRPLTPPVGQTGRRTLTGFGFCTPSAACGAAGTGPTAVVRAPSKLSGAPVMATDLRASMGLIVAGLAAENSTEISRVYHLDRGYEALDAKLRALGAGVERVRDEEAA